jgi:predicted aminopeptidase
MIEISTEFMVWKVIKRFLLVLLAAVVIGVVVYWDLVSYGLRQAKGQLSIVWNARPVEEFLLDPTFPDSLKARLQLIGQVRKYAIDSLGLKDTENYKTLFDQQGEEVMWVVTACEPFMLEAKQWNFPVIGSVPYKGFFDKQKAVNLRNDLEKEGWDVSIRNPGGWSTLGWFTDPILSKMLERSEGDLANLIIHEMSHSTIFVKDSIDFNENLATFIGDRGAEKFLIHKYGAHARELDLYLNEDKDYITYVNHMLRGTARLDSLYKSMKPEDTNESKLGKKRKLIGEIVSSLDTLSFSGDYPKPSTRFKDRLPNNAYFINFIRYQAKQDDFWIEYRKDFNEDLKAYISYLGQKYPFL